MTMKEDLKEIAERVLSNKTDSYVGAAKVLAAAFIAALEEQSVEGTCNECENAEVLILCGACRRERDASYKKLADMIDVQNKLLGVAAKTIEEQEARFSSLSYEIQTAGTSEMKAQIHKRPYDALVEAETIYLIRSGWEESPDPKHKGYWSSEAAERELLTFGHAVNAQKQYDRQNNYVSKPVPAPWKCDCVHAPEEHTEGYAGCCIQGCPCNVYRAIHPGVSGDQLVRSGGPSVVIQPEPGSCVPGSDPGTR